MTNLSRVLRAYMESHRLSAREVARRTDIEPSQISRILNGKQDGISADYLSRFARVVGQTRLERGEIIAAHLRDECRGPGADMVRVVVAGGTRTPAVRRDASVIGFLRRKMDTDPAMRKLLTGLAEVHGWRSSVSVGGKSQRRAS